MVSPQAAQVVLAVYGVLTLAGGVIGYVKAGSKPSLVAGVTAGVIAGISAWIAGWNLRLGSIQGALLAVVLASFFAVRFRKTRKWMPAGMMMVVSQAAAVFLLIAVMTAFAGQAE